MPIFGQVWLWSLLAFLLGALLCWLLVVLPVRRRITALESRLASLRADAKVSAATAERSRTADRSEDAGAPSGLVPGFGDREARDEIRADTLTRAYTAPVPPTVPPMPRGDGTEVAPRPAAERDGGDWFGDQPAAPAEGHAVAPHADEPEDDEERGTIFAQRTTPIPRELIRRLDAEEQPAEPEPDPEALPSRAAHRLGEARVDDGADRPEEAAPTTFLPTVTDSPEPPAAPVAPPPPAEPEPEMFRPARRVAPAARSDVDRVADRPVAASPAPRARVAEMPNRTTFEPSVKVEPERSSSALPKRVPAKPQHRVPFGVATVSPATPPAGTQSGGERVRSLFEPVVPAEEGQEEMPPPPGKLSGGGAPGPFGPGSAMPLPGGEPPSPEFTVKASVSALRYCTPDDTQFGRTVAEVWFRSAADAERVGFRPVG